jgi:hypothetical protein
VNLLYLNAQSFLSNKIEIEMLVEEKKPKILFLSETRITSDISDHEIEIDGYDVVRCDSHTRHTGGVSIHIHESIRFEIVSNIMHETYWFLLIRVRNIVNPGFYGVVYRSPSGNKDIFLKFVEEQLEKYTESNQFHLLVGDFNLNWVDHNDSKVKQLKHIVSLSGMVQKVSDYTRVTQTTRTVIDLVITNDKSVNVDVLSTPRITDHNIIEINNICAELRNDERDLVEISSWKNYSKQKLIEELDKVNWSSFELMNLEQKATNFIEIMSKCVNNLVVKKKVDVKKHKAWYNDGHKKLKYEMNTSYTRASITGDDEDWNQYKVNRNVYVNKLRNDRDKNDQDLIERNKNDPKNLWKVLKKLVKQKSKVKKNIVFDGNVIEDKELIVNGFNEYFIDSITAINDSIENVQPRQSDLSNSSMCENSFRFKTIDINELEKYCENLSDNCGMDNITGRVMKDAFSVIGKFLLEIINESLITGVFPASWRTSTVVPIPKVNNSNKCEDYRPIYAASI